MARPMQICGIVLTCVFISVEAQASTHTLLECRICRAALSLEHCNETQLCSTNEECYTDEIITSSLQIIFNAGCRSIPACKTTNPHAGKRQVYESLLACSDCCNVPKTSNTTECNANICGLKTTVAPTTSHGLLECRICRNALYLEDCNETQLCSTNEECYTDEIITSSLQIIFNAGCRSIMACKATDPHAAKRQVYEGLMACSHCCNVPKTSNTTECNANICGLKTTVAPTTSHGLLQCRICRNALYLEDCKETQLCSRNEECYTDEIITPSLQIIFNAGCRSITACKTTNPHAGQIAANHSLIACSHCCNVPKTSNTTECNANLCGLKTKNSNTNQCYHCSDDADARQGAVLDVRKCRQIKLCADDQVCRVTTKSTGSIMSYEFGCHNLLQCQILTILNLEQSQNVITHIDLAHLQGTGEIVGRKRQINLCDVCCGDALCNDDQCESVRYRLGQFARGGRLNYTTLKLIR